MTRLLTCGIIAFAVFGATPALAQSRGEPSATELLQGLAGHWDGALIYRDYQTDARIEIPVATNIEVLPDQATMIRRSLYNDGPGNPVWITSVSLTDNEGGVESASYRAGRDVEVIEETVSVARASGVRDWTLVYSSIADDDDAPAEIRVTETLAGDDYTATKEVRPVGADDGAWVFRNETRLSRRGD